MFCYQAAWGAENVRLNTHSLSPLPWAVKHTGPPQKNELHSAGDFLLLRVPIHGQPHEKAGANPFLRLDLDRTTQLLHEVIDD